jgi:hypothetical protein
VLVLVLVLVLVPGRPELPSAQADSAAAEQRRSAAAQECRLSA